MVGGGLFEIQRSGRNYFTLNNGSDQDIAIDGDGDLAVLCDDCGRAAYTPVNQIEALIETYRKENPK